jgi:hypothetical protein
MTCSLVEIYPFEGNWCLHLQGGRRSSGRNVEYRLKGEQNPGPWVGQ